MGLINEATAFAAHKHIRQFRRNGLTPFVAHPVSVMNRLIRHGVRDREVLAAAVLHDTLEDTDTTFEELETKFGPRVAELVDELTREPGESKDDYMRLFEYTSPDACIIKLSDRIDNLLDSPKDPVAYSIQARILLEAVKRNIGPWSVKKSAVRDKLLNVLDMLTEYPAAWEMEA